jgi:DNA-binding LacI/PurR family transcriptional regulator
MVQSKNADGLREQIANWALLSAGGLCGVIAVGDWPDGVLPDMLGSVPTVVSGRGGGPEVIQPDRSQGIRQLFSWLSDLGHRKIGLVRAEQLSPEQALLEGAFRYSTLQRGDETPAIGSKSDGAPLRKMTLTGVTAWICEGDATTHHTQTLLAEAKLHAPVDLSFAVIDSHGFNGGVGFATVTYPWRRMGALAIGRLRTRMSASTELPDAVNIIAGSVVGGIAAGPPPGVR